MRKFRKNSRLSGEVSLQITSMADIFTIILVFLLKSSATSSIDISPSAGMIIPEGQSLQPPEEALKIQISQDSVQVEGRPVAQLSNFRFQSGEVGENQTSTSVNASLEKEKKRQKMIAEVNSDVHVNSKILIVADQRTPYVTLKSILSSAAMNGFTDYKLVVVNKD